MYRNSRVLTIPLLMIAFAASLASAGNVTPPAPEPGVMLREGNWAGDVGTYLIPAALVGLKPVAWPDAGWMRLALLADRVDVEPVAVDAGKPPEFLESIRKQLRERELVSDQPTPTTAQAAAYSVLPDRIYLRVPGVSLRPGSAAAYRFKNGTSQLRPILDYRYSLALDGRDFAFTVQNGRRNKAGVAYGEGAQIHIEYDGNTYEYNLGQFGWDVTIQAIADLDGDGKPDFIVAVGVSNGSYEAILLSSLASPGRNPPTASLSAIGC